MTKTSGVGTFRKIGRGCAARFLKPLPYFRPKSVIFPTLHQTWRPVTRRMTRAIHEQYNWTIHGRKLARFLHAVLNVGNIQKAFRWFLEIIQTLSKMTFIQCKDFKMSPGFCTLGVGRYASGKPAVSLQNLGCFLKLRYLHKLSVNNVSGDIIGIRHRHRHPYIQTPSSKGGNFGQCFWKA